MFNIVNCFMTKKEEPLKPPKPPKPKEYIIVDTEFENNECIICLDNMIKNDHIKMLGCGHIYHNKCINDWFVVKKECPICYK